MAGIERILAYVLTMVLFLLYTCGLEAGGSHLWLNGLPSDVRKSILWSADHEEGSLDDWTFGDPANAGGGVFNTGGEDVETKATKAVAHSGEYAAEATITNAFQARNGSRAVRLMRWTDKPWPLGGSAFPKTAYYSVWMHFPKIYNPNKYRPWDPGDGGWWNVFQFKSKRVPQVESDPVWVLNVGHDDSSGNMFFYLYSHQNTPASYRQKVQMPIPVGQWVHVEVCYVQSPSDGSITVWQDGVKIFHVPRVRTILGESMHWGIGNYADHIVGDRADGSATIYFDDAVVSLKPVHPYVR